MAITPTQAQQLTQQQEAEINRWEASIDKLLVGIGEFEKRLIEMPVGFSDRMYNELKSRYTKAGWNVVKDKMEKYDDRPGTTGTPYKVDAWRFSIASTSGCSAYDYYNK